MQQTAGLSLADQRRKWAERIRAPIRAHPKQWAFVTSDAKLRATDKNRRAGGTEGVGRDALALLIERDEWTVEVYTETLQEYSKNWLCREPGPSFFDLLDDVGCREGEHYRVSRYDPQTVKSITFSWGSRLTVCSAADATQLRRKRGGRPHMIIVDEAQNQPLLGEIVSKIVMAASADFDAVVIFVGTPGPEVDTFFYSIVSGGLPEWEVHHFYSVDNPFFGDSWDERYERAVASRVRKFGGSLNESPQNIERLATLTESEFRQLAQADTEDLPPGLQELARTANPDILRELIGRWVAEDSQYVHPPFRQMDDEQLYWAEWAPGLNAGNMGRGTGDDMFAAPQSWPARFAQLPKVKTHWGPRDKTWSAVMAFDFGYFPDPFAAWAGVHSREHGALLEFESQKANRLTEPEQFAVVRAWLDGFRALGIRVVGIVCDAGGAEAMPVIQGWLDKLRPLMPAGWQALEAAQKSNAWAQRWQMNAEMRAGRLQFLRNSPTAIEGKYLKRLPPDPEQKRKRPEVAKHRTVEVKGQRLVPGDHCLDAARYIWYWSTHVWNSEHSEDRYVEPAEQMRKQMLAGER